MTTWTSDELTRIEHADELRLQYARPDGTLRKPVTIWVVRDGDDLYVRAVGGREGRWFRSAQDRHEGRVQSGGVERNVTFEEVGDDNADTIDDIFRQKYQKYPAQYVDPTVTPNARAATLRLVPR